MNQVEDKVNEFSYKLKKIEDKINEQQTILSDILKPRADSISTLIYKNDEKLKELEKSFSLLIKQVCNMLNAQDINIVKLNKTVNRIKFSILILATSQILIMVICNIIHNI